MNLCFPKQKPSKTSRNKSTKSKTSLQTTTHQQYHATHPKPPTEQPLLSRDEARKLRRLQKDGIVILIDQPNLEIGMGERERNRMKLAGKKNPCWALSYGCLKHIIARRGLSDPPRRVLGTYIITSKKFQTYQSHRRRPSSKYLKRNKITLVRSPDERTTGGREKSVDSMLVRIMTQEFEGIEIQRLNGKTPPKRTFCLVTGDFDFVDVVQQAREVGCDVEIWFWTRQGEMTKQWDQKSVRCQSERCGCLTIRDLEPYLKKLTRDWNDNSDAWSVLSNTDTS